MTTFIDTNKIERTDAGTKNGAFAEIANKDLCGAENFVTSLRWLESGESLKVQDLPNTCQLVYVIEGRAVISLNEKDYDVAKGAGVYLDPDEGAEIRHNGSKTTKLLHLVVPKLSE